MWKHVLIVFVLALACRLLVYTCANSHPPLAGKPAFALLNPDSGTYDQLALNLTRYGIYSESANPNSLAPAAERGPGYPAFMALVYRVLGHRPQAIIVLQIILGSLTAALVCLVGYNLGGRLAGLAGGLLMALDLPSIIYANLLLTETLSALITLIAVCTLWLGWRASGGGNVILLAATGVLAGIAAYVRTAAVLWPVVLIVCSSIYYRQVGKILKSAMYVGLGFLIVITPWIVRNTLIFSAPEFSSGAGNCVLYFNASAVVAAKNGISPSKAISLLKSEIEPHVEGTPEAQFRDSHVKTNMGLTILRDNKSLTAKLFAKCFLRTLLGPSRGFLNEITAYPMVIVSLSAVLGTLALIFAIYGLWAMARRPQLIALAMLIALSLVYAGAVAFLQGYSRFRIPYIPLLMLAAGMGVQAIHAAISAKRKSPTTGRAPV